MIVLGLRRNAELGDRADAVEIFNLAARKNAQAFLKQNRAISEQGQHCLAHWRSPNRCRKNYRYVLVRVLKNRKLRWVSDRSNRSRSEQLRLAIKIDRPSRERRKAGTCRPRG